MRKCLFTLCLALWLLPLGTAPLHASAPESPSDDLPQTNQFYLPILPPSAVDGAYPQLIPIIANHAFDRPQPAITRIIIALHGRDRDAAATLNLLSDLAGSANADTLILAPAFLTKGDIVRMAPKLPDKGRMFATWLPTAWSRGDASESTSAGKSISSFAVLDILLSYINQPTWFANADDIIIVGIGEGGSMADLYAASSHAQDVIIGDGKRLRYVVADAPHHLYLTSARYRDKKHGFGTPDSERCPAYDQWPYGLQKLNPYAARIGANSMKTGYIHRPMTMLFGELANDDNTGDDACAKNLQGSGTLSRTLNYQQYLAGLFGESPQHHFALIPKVGHEAAGLLGSTCGIALLFGDGHCEEPHRP